ncbi:peptidoglycan transpeptidase precursor, ErfK-YbiS-YhnG family [Butyrivibrio proteoclasticus]|uniref:Peptidoglycan transpeptidase, ErfK-YbiS-YhnG family n=1 Tax=Butyrivibrio proteoclasticus TaxID=43305 RepID=A0A1I5QGJ6_9FIRM|nr:L,D-transpeptidase [Butyrivibrio proteoclasticus]SFP45378.1 peptidoglycan transpeptidase precursor, ErfK-YbiS-YhnG family [Butyrivibrio proteoclasticus]
MSRAIKGLLITLAVSIAAFIAVYIGFGFYYMNGFPCFTWINGVYCTGKSVDEVNEELCKKYQYDGINITDISGAELYISAKDANVRIDFTDKLNSYLSDKNSFAWGYYFFENLIVNLSPDVYVDKDVIKDIIFKWEIFLDDDEFNISIEKTRDSGYVLKDNLSKAPVQEAISQAVIDSIKALKTEIRLYTVDGCYTEIQLNEEQQKIVDLYDKVNALQSCMITFKIADEEVKLDKKIASSFILTEDDLESAKEEKVSKKLPGSGLFIAGSKEEKFPEDDIIVVEGFLMDSDGNLILSESRMYDFLYELLTSHGTEWDLVRYRSGDADAEININSNSKGNGLVYDINSEFEFLKAAYLSGEAMNEEVRTLQLSDSVAVFNAKESLGDTYIEVNMGKQELFYYAEGKLVMNMPIVTGNVNRGRGTPTGIFSVYNKRYHTNLVGVDYVSYVNYWLGVHKGVGIHDATWRSKFGEEIYKRDGSHGCINCPLDTVSQLWEVVEVGTPVILYY